MVILAVFWWQRIVAFLPPTGRMAELANPLLEPAGSLTGLAQNSTALIRRWERPTVNLLVGLALSRRRRPRLRSPNGRHGMS